MSQHEDVLPLEVLGTIDDMGVNREVRPTVPVRMGEGVMRQNSIALGKALLDFCLQRFERVARVVAVIVQALRPAVFLIVGLALIGTESPETDQRWLVQIVVRAVAVEVMSSFVCN